MLAAMSPNAALIIIGNEILSGRTQDKNAAYIAQKLQERGIRLMEIRVVPDDEAKIIATVNELRARFDYIFTTGGIGPTHDDITATCIAKAFGLAFGHHPQALDILQKHYGDQLTEARARMAMMPLNAKLIPNPVSAAPGFIVENVYVMAGVPKIMQAMFDHVVAGLRTGPALVTRSVFCAIPESVLAPGLSALQDEFADVEIGSYPHFQIGDIGVSIVARGTDAARVETVAQRVFALMQSMGGTPRWE